MHVLEERCVFISRQRLFVFLSFFFYCFFALQSEKVRVDHLLYNEKYHMALDENNQIIGGFRPGEKQGLKKPKSQGSNKYLVETEEEKEEI
jgi:hypothetical protein